MIRDSFVFYRSFYEAVKSQDDKTISDLFKAICEYALNHEEIELNGIEKMAFELIKPQLEANYKKALSGCKGGQARAKQSQAKGKQNEAKTKQTQAKGKQSQANINVNANVNVNDNVDIISNSKKIYGEFKNVKLTDDEYSKLAKDYPVEILIQILDEAKEQHGYKYKSDYLAIKNWVVKEYESRQKNPKKDIEVIYDSSINKPMSDEELKALEEFRGNPYGD